MTLITTRAPYFAGPLRTTPSPFRSSQRTHPALTLLPTHHPPHHLLHHLCAHDARQPNRILTWIELHDVRADDRAWQRLNYRQHLSDAQTARLVMRDAGRE